MSKFSKKLGSDSSYRRPKMTYQDQLSQDEINEKIQGYSQVDDISQVPVNTHIRYFITQDDGSYAFRMGGFLKDKSNSDKYVVLTNGKNHWSVQVKDTIFLRKMSHTEEIESLHETYRNKLHEKDKIITKMEKIIKKKYPDFSIDLYFAEKDSKKKINKSEQGGSKTSKSKTSKTNASKYRKK
ncbi:hypothetical protein [Powai lake megavirus]|uniref:Uncharacterized protein n=1 Tax=Powai lake megavirus TaxID=1842663 RepID=A0A167R8H1_9VIRU|nr:hypothetical protein QJ849_gp257 [Powai lake megavirus]ANB50419.1 hypothetical protein [Powai lake megavirus]